jgi:hypothetical protein
LAEDKTNENKSLYNGTVILFSTVSSKKFFLQPFTAQETILVLNLMAKLTAV